MPLTGKCGRDDGSCVEGFVDGGRWYHNYTVGSSSVRALRGKHAYALRIAMPHDLHVEILNNL